MFSFNVFRPAKAVIPSMDYYNRLEKEIEILRADLKKVERKLELKESGLQKVLHAVPPVHVSQRPKQKKHIFLTLEDVNNIESSILAGWKPRQICAKYGVSYNTVWRIMNGKHTMSKRPATK